MIRSTAAVLALIFFIAGPSARAQEDARAAWQVTNFDITVNNLGAERALTARAIISVRNVGRAPGSTLSLRINSKAEIKNASIGGATAAYRSTPEARGGTQRITITLPGSVASGNSLVATVDYRLPVEDNSGLFAISPVASQFLPLALWYPAPSTPFAVRGPDCAPFRISVNGVTAIASGVDKSANGDSVFVQSLNAMPFFVAGNWDRVDGSGSGKGINAFLSKGADADERKQADALIGLAADARTFYAGLFGSSPDVPVRLVAVTRGAGFSDSGTILLGDGAFRRRKIDAATALAISEAVAQIWVGGDTPVRGEGYGVLREGLARFFATLFIEKQFGAEAAEAERARERMSYASIAKRDFPLSRTTPLDPTYFNSISNKGAMVWRLIDHVVGRDVFIAAVRGLLLSGKTDPDGLTLARARAVFAERGSASLKALMDQELDQPTDMDLMAGLPHQEAGVWMTALRNLGSIEAAVNVASTTDTGQVVTVQGTIAAHDFGQVTFKNPGKIVRVEVDPEKFYPQLDYANDVAPRSADVATSLGEASRLFGTQEYAKAEAIARELLAASPRLQEARILFARALLAQNRIEDAEKEFRSLGEDRLPTAAALAWSSIGLGEVALKRGRAADAVRYFTDGVRADAEYGSTLAARAGRIRAEGNGATSPIDESAKTFVGQLDNAIRSGRKAELSAIVVPGELAGFVRGVIGTQPEAWQSRVVRTDALDANRLAVDVVINSKQLGVEHSGTAVFVLARAGGTWKLNAIDFFEVR